MRKTRFYKDGYYHVYNRGVDKRTIFESDDDREKFLRSMADFSIAYKEQKIRQLIQVVAYCLMDNHFHMLLKQMNENGVSEFMHRIGTGYTMFFNKKYKRTGSLFESRFKSVEMKSQAQFLHISRYIHLNPVKGYQEGRDRVLKTFRWSSYRHYIGLKKDEFVNESPIMGMFSSPVEYNDFLLSWEAQPSRLSLD